MGNLFVSMKKNQVAISETPYGIFKYLESDVYIAPFFARGQVYEQDLIEKFLFPIIQKSQLVVDIGAHIGSHSITYATMNPKIQVLSFEIQKPIFELLLENISLNKLENRVHAFLCAVGPHSGKARISNTIHDEKQTLLSYHSSQPINFGGVALGNTGQAVNMIALDDLKLTRCDFIKMDVEGFEPFVIEGARETIKRFHPPIFYEQLKPITSEMLTFFKRDEKSKPLPVEDQLRALGYTNFDKLQGPNMLATIDFVPSIIL